MGLINEVTEDPLTGPEFASAPAETLIATRKLLRPDLEGRLKEEAAAVVAAARRREFKKALEEFLARV